MPSRLMRIAASAATAILILLFASDARAGDAAAAEALFSDARELADAGKFEEACPKFAESQRLDPGMGTLYNLGDCYEHLGKTASAWAAFREVADAARAAGQADRAADADDRAKALEPKLARMRIDVDANTRALRGLVVERDEIAVGEGQFGVALPSDPGKHRIIARAPGHREWSQEVEVPATAGEVTVQVPALVEAPDDPQSRSDGAEPGYGEYDSGASTRGLGTQRTIALVAAGVGVAGVAVGTIFGISSMSKKSSADDHCDANNVCDAEGVDLRDGAITAGTISTIGYTIGAAGLVGAAVLWFTAPNPSARSASFTLTPHVSGRAAGIQLGGRF